MLTRTVGTDARADQRHMCVFFGLIDRARECYCIISELIKRARMLTRADLPEPKQPLVDTLRLACLSVDEAHLPTAAPKSLAGLWVCRGKG